MSREEALSARAAQRGLSAGLCPRVFIISGNYFAWTRSPLTIFRNTFFGPKSAPPRAPRSSVCAKRVVEGVRSLTRTVTGACCSPGAAGSEVTLSRGPRGSWRCELGAFGPPGSGARTAPAKPGAREARLSWGAEYRENPEMCHLWGDS